MVGDIMNDLGSLCKKLATIYGFLGAIGTIILAVKFGKVADIGWSGVDYERDWGLTLTIFFASGLSVAIVTVALYTLGEIHDKLVGLKYLFEDANKPSALQEGAKEAEDRKILENGGWKCPDCGKIHRGYETSCTCGRSKNS